MRGRLSHESPSMFQIRRSALHQLSIALFSASAAIMVSPSSLQAQRGGPAPIVVSQVVQEPVAAGQQFVGTITPVQTAAVGSAVDGRVADFPVNEGDFVKSGSALAQLLTATITLELESAQAELELRQHEHAELKNGSRPEEVEQARAAMASAQAVQEYNIKRLKRAEELFQRTAVNSEELQLILSQKIKADQDYNQAKAHFDLIQQGPRIEQIQQAEARVKIQEALVQKLEDQLGKHTMKAPFDGYISAEHTERGQWVQRGELVAEVIKLDYVDVMTYVPEQYIRFVNKGQQVRVDIPALPDHLFEGTVALVVPQADVQSRTFPVKVRIENKIDENGPLIKSGMMAQVILPTGAESDSLLVPKDAIVLGMAQKMVYAVVPAEGDKPATVRPVQVVLGSTTAKGIVVRGDLTTDDQVVVRGNDRMRPGMPVVVQSVVSAAEASPQPE